MAGHMLVNYFQKQTPYQVMYTLRSLPWSNPCAYQLDARDPLQLRKVVEKAQPDIVVNAAGVLIADAARDPADAYLVNAWFPHALAGLLTTGKLIQISTDCVFAGDRGHYAEQDQPDGISVYARTKQLGEVAHHHHLTVRTSLIGPELRRPGRGLMAWFLRQSDAVKGFTRVMWNGVTTLELAKALHSLIEQRASGIYHLAHPEPISKYELLMLLREVFKLKVAIVPDDHQRINRTLLHTRTDVDYAVPSYDKMILALREWMRSA